MAGLRVAVVAEGFGIPGLSQPGVDEVVRAAIGTLAGGRSERHRGEHPVAPRRAARLERDRHRRRDRADDRRQRVRDERPGRYDPDLIAHYAAGRRAPRQQIAETLKLTVLTGRYAIDHGDGQHYAMARNLALELTAAYDAALAGADVLVMPTLPIVASASGATPARSSWPGRWR